MNSDIMATPVSTNTMPAPNHGKPVRSPEVRSRTVRLLQYTTAVIVTKTGLPSSDAASVRRRVSVLTVVRTCTQSEHNQSWQAEATTKTMCMMRVADRCEQQEAETLATANVRLCTSVQEKSTSFSDSTSAPPLHTPELRAVLECSRPRCTASGGAQI